MDLYRDFLIMESPLAQWVGWSNRLPSLRGVLTGRSPYFHTHTDGLMGKETDFHVFYSLDMLGVRKT